MSSKQPRKGPVSLDACPPKEFAGRAKEKKKLLEILEGVKNKGKVIVVLPCPPGPLTWRELPVGSRTRSQDPADRHMRISLLVMILLYYS